MTSADRVYIRQSETGAVAIDVRYAPLIVSCFIGEVNLPLGMWYERTTNELIDGEASGSQAVVNIHDATHSVRTSAEMRRFWADLGTRNDAAVAARTRHNFIVVGSTITRGVITAVSWLNPSVAQIQVFGSLAKAVVEAVVRLEAAGARVELPGRQFVYTEAVGRLLQESATPGRR